MPFLRLRDLRSGDSREFRAAEIRIGRDPECEFVIVGEGREVVSATHARVVFRDDAWWVEDAGSRNGTFVGDRRLGMGETVPVSSGDIVRLGRGGVRFEIGAVEERRISETLAEAPAGILDALRDASAPEEDQPTDLLERPTPPAVSIAITLTDLGDREVFHASGKTVQIGRGRRCAVRPATSDETSVSRVHAEILLNQDGVAVVRDAGSRNGTLVNGTPLTNDHVLRVGDLVKLGELGPELRVDRLVPTPPAAAAAAVAKPLRRSFGGRGRTTFFTEKLAESSRRSARRQRIIVFSFVGLLAAAVSVLYWHSERRAQETATLLAVQQQQMLAAQATADSLGQAAREEYTRLEQQLVQAQMAAAPVAVVESLRTALQEAGDRTTLLEEALQRAQTDLAQQVAAGDSMQRRAQSDLSRLRTELRRARETQVSADEVDSLRSAVRAAEARASALASQVRAVKGVNLAAVAQANQAAVGLVTAYFGGEIFDGSGFAITPSGLFVTNRHVVTEQGTRADSLFVTMADQRFMVRSDIVAVAQPGGPDLALLRIRGSTGPTVSRVDWSGTSAKQGEPAALIGFPAGLSAALDRDQTVRTSMSAGVFSKITADLIQFDGFTVGGSSGSPIFNADGAVVAVHRAGLREAAGLGFAVPIPLLIPLLPPDARAELGLP